MILSYLNFNILTKDYSRDFIIYIVNQMKLMYKECFGISNWDPINSKMHIVIDVDETNGYMVRGFLNVADMKNNSDNGEIYNVCVHPNYRGKGVLGELINNLPPKQYYFLQVLFENKRAYSAYLKYFFCDFFAIGYLSYSNTVAFILGGYPSKKCIKQRDTYIQKLNNISENIDNINKHYDFQRYFDHILSYHDTYQFIMNHRDLINTIVTLKSNKISLSDDIHKVIHFPVENSNEILDIKNNDLLIFILRYIIYIHPILIK